MLWLASAFAADWYIPTDFSTLQQAVDDPLFVQSGDVIHVPAGTYTGFYATSGRSLTIEGAGMGLTTLVGSGGDDVVGLGNGSAITLRDLTLDGQGQWRGLDVTTSDAVLERVHIDAGRAPTGEGGGGIRAQTLSSVLATDVMITLCTATEGAGIKLDGATLAMSGSMLSSNSASGAGGALEVAEGSVAIFDACDFSGNAALTGGAGRVRGTGVFRTSTFWSNAADNGGALTIGGTAADVTVADVVFLDNAASINGGAISGNNGNVFVERTRFVDNVAGAGAVIRAGGGTWAVQNVYACGNSASDDSVLAMTGSADFVVDSALFVLNGPGTTVGSNGLYGPGVVYNSTFWADLGNPIVTLGDGSLRDSVVGADVGAGQTGVLGLGGLGVSQGNLFWNVAQTGVSTNTIANPGFQLDPADCDTAFYATATSNIFAVASRSDGAGAPYDIGHLGGPVSDPVFWQDDQDGDGYSRTVDCDDGDPQVHPGAVEVCDGVDSDCDGTPETLATWFRDADGDGAGDTSVTLVDCAMPSGYVAAGTDCDDGDNAIHPGAAEVCNGVDDDCDGDVDAADANAVLDAFWPDADSDGFGDVDAVATLSCTAPSGFTDDGTDCDDAAPSVYPGAPEACPDNIDNDCDTLVDAADPDYTDQGVEYWRDADFDGVGDPADSVVACSGDEPSGYVPASFGSDCDDADPLATPGNTEVCDGIDNDCNGVVDQGFVSSPYWPDVDDDGFGDAGVNPIISCTPLPGHVTSGTDCDDDDASIRPFATEICDTIDQDCNGVADDGLPTSTWYVDADQDGYGDADDPGTTTCEMLTGHVTDGTDCDDASADVNPGQPEIPDDGVDNDCAGGDEITPDLDSDGDGIPDSIDPDPDSNGDDGAHPPPDPKHGCGCASPGAPLPWALVLAGALSMRSRRRAR
ncbi:MAG: hypothetical protein H6737_15240 [Alphaproteobacteria bacterium]|nr:hypothetical protein [Alphaproteobacteria bacterium]